MGIEQIVSLRRISWIAYSRHPVARLCCAWRNFAGDPARRSDSHAVDILSMPLAGLALTILLLATMPDASDAIAAACSMACMP
jgi:hypothetical protein